jgi:2-keto-4-pentenoate hydratase/2-oxohepta-3-ene-1,7-dioic acid hydratase in catechol pathway
MRLCSYQDADGKETLGLVAADHVVPASDVLRGAPRTIAELLATPGEFVGQLAAVADPDRIQGKGRRLQDMQLLAPVPRPGKVVAIGRNYREHAAEEGIKPPAEPLIFAKFSSSVVGPGADICWDGRLALQVDYEAELAVVIGRTARRVSPREALDAVLGYTCLNDVSARDLQFGDGQWTRGKSLDSFCPMGPVIVTGDELGDASDLAIRCLVNGEERQSSSTSYLYFGIAEIISHCSQAFTLEPGDIIATGTPGGVGHFRTPAVYLADGDEVVVEIDRVGRLVNRCRIEAPR